MSVSRVAPVCLLISIAFAPRTSRADAGEVALGVQVGGAYEPAAGRAGVALRLGTSDWASVEGRLGLGLGDDRAAGLVAGGLVVAWDVLAWVPELTVTAGFWIDRERSEPRISGELGVRRYVGRRWAIGLAAGSEWGPEAGALVIARASLWFEP